MTLSKNLLWYDAVPENDTPKWMIEGIWQKNALNMLVGSPKSHKSALRRYFVACLIAGKEPLNGFKIGKRPNKTLIFIGEDRPGSERLMFDKLAKHMACESFHNQIAFIQSQYFKIDNQGQFNQLKKMVVDEGFELVLFDSLRSFHNKNENDSNEVAQVFNPLTELKALTTVVCIHHRPKPQLTQVGFGGDHRTASEKARGSGAIGGYADTTTVLDRYGKSDRHYMEFETKEMWEPEPIKVVLDSDSWAWRIQDEDLTEEVILRMVENQQGILKTKLIRKLGFRHQTCKEMVEEMIKAKVLKIRQVGRNQEVYTKTANFPS